MIIYKYQDINMTEIMTDIIVMPNQEVKKNGLRRDNSN